MADATILNSDLSALEMTYVSDLIVEAGRNYSNPLKYFTNVSNEIGYKGKACAVQIAPVLSSYLATDGNSLTLNNTVATTSTVTLNKDRVFAFSRTNVAGAIAGDVQLRNHLKASIVGMLNDVESDCLSLITSGITTNVAGTYNTAVTSAAIQAAGAALDEAKAPQFGRVGILRHGAKAYDAFTALITYTNTGAQSPLVKDNSGGIFYNDVTWFKSQALPRNTNNTDNVILTPGAIAIAMRNPELPVAGALCDNIVDTESGLAFQIVSQYDINKRANVWAVQMLYGVSILKETYGALLKA